MFLSESDNKEVLSRAEAARFLGICLRHLDTLTKQGVIPCRHLGARVVYSRHVLLEWLRNGEQSTVNLITA